MAARQSRRWKAGFKTLSARKFFSKITSDAGKYDVVDSYGKLMELVK